MVAIVNALFIPFSINGACHMVRVNVSIIKAMMLFICCLLVVDWVRRLEDGLSFLTIPFPFLNNHLPRLTAICPMF